MEALRREPPSHVVFILATTEADKVLSTIKSRCQQYVFRNLSITDIENILKHILSKETIGYEDEAIFLIAKNARGSVRDAETILEKMIAYTSDKNFISRDDVTSVIGGNNFNYIRELFNIMMSSDKKQYFLFINKIFAESIDPKNFLISLIEYMRIILMMKTGVDDIKVLEISESEKQDMFTFVNHYSPRELEIILEYILDIEEKVRYASQPRVIFQMRLLFLLDLNSITKTIVVDNLLNVTNQSTSSQLETNMQIQSQASDKIKPASGDDKKTIFYKRVLSHIANESNTIYSLLSQGEPKYSEGPVLFVELPENVYEMISTDKRSFTLVQNALQANSTNPNVRIEFVKKQSVSDDIVEKLKATFDAKPIDSE